MLLLYAINGHYSCSVILTIIKFVLQIWAFEAMPKFGEMLANKLALNEKNKNGPRCLRWQIVKNPSGTSFERCLEAMR